MARDVNGNYTLHASNPVVSGTYVLASWANSTMSDLAAEITGSLSRNGYGGMLAALRCVAGSLAAPGISFVTSTGSGMYWDSVNSDVVTVVNGAAVTKARAGGNLYITGTAIGDALQATTTVAAGTNITAGGTITATGAVTGGSLVSGAGVTIATGQAIANANASGYFYVGSSGTGYWRNTNATFLFQNTSGSSTYFTIDTASASHSALLTAPTVTAASSLTSSGSLTVGTSATVGTTLSTGVGYTTTHTKSGNTTTASATQALLVQNQGGTGDADVAGINFLCQGSWGTSLHLRHDGYIGIGGWSSATWRWYVSLSTGDMVAAGNVSAYSDRRHKTDIVAIPHALSKVLQMQGVRYTRRDTGRTEVGLVADDVEKIAPELVIDSGQKFQPPPIDDGYGNLAYPPVDADGPNVKALAYQNLTAYLVEALKESHLEIDVLRARLDSREATLAQVLKRLEALEDAVG